MKNLSSKIEQYLEYCQRYKKLSKHTIKAYDIDLHQFLNFKTESNLSKEFLSEYIIHLHEHYKPKSVKRKIAALKAFSKYLYRQDIIPFNPFEKIDTSFKEPQQLPRTIPQHIIANMLDIAYTNINLSVDDDSKKTAVRNAALLELLFATGARISEICSLKPENIDLYSGSVLFFGKGSKERMVPIEHNDVLLILTKYKLLFEKSILQAGYFFVNSRNTRFSEQSARKMLKDLELQAHSAMHVTPHMFRHSVATYLLEEDVDIRYIQQILGHSSIRTTQIYTHVSSGKQKEILKTKHPRNKIRIQQNDS